MPGDVGFDPLGLAKFDPFGSKPPKSDDELLDTKREAELTHGRYAMLAAIAYPLQEAIDPILSKALGLPNVLPLGKLSPSLVNGGLTAPTVIAFLGLSAALEF